MQYKIPVQIENEDPIFLWLSLRQLAIVIIWGWIWYNIFKALVDTLWPEISAIPAILILLLAIVIAKFKVAWMTFMQFIFSFIRFKVNLEERKWLKTVDSFQAIDIWYVSETKENKEKINLDNKKSKLEQLEDKINKL